MSRSLSDECPRNYREIKFQFIIHAARADVVIGAMARPLNRKKAEDTADYLSRHEKCTLISLYENCPYPEEAERKGITYRHFPIVDFSVASIEQHNVFYHVLAAEVRYGNNVVVHCGAGDGRSGTMLSGIKLRQQLQHEFLGIDPEVLLRVDRSSEVHPSDDYGVYCSKRLSDVVAEIRRVADEWGNGGFAIERMTDIESLQRYERALIAKYNDYLSKLKKDPTGDLALMDAIKNNDIEMLDLLQLRGCRCKFEHIQYAIKYIQNNLLINNIIIRTDIKELNRSDAEGKTLLMEAVMLSRFSVVKQLVECRCDVTARDKSGKMAVEYVIDGQPNKLADIIRSYQQERCNNLLSGAKKGDAQDLELQKIVDRLTSLNCYTATNEDFNEILKTIEDVQTEISKSTSHKMSQLFQSKNLSFDVVVSEFKKIIEFSRYASLLKSKSGLEAFSSATHGGASGKGHPGP